MMSHQEHIGSSPALETPTAPRQSRVREYWHLFKKNKLAIAGMVIFLLFFAAALVGLMLTSGADPLLDPAQIRLQEKLRPPPVQAEPDARAAP